jgi:3-oxoacyl-[acyl-carrier-protein] synthase II
MLSTPNPDKGYGEAAELDEDEQPGLPREVRYLRRAIDEAIDQAGLIDAEGNWQVTPERCGIVMGTTLHGMPAAGRYTRSGNASDLGSFLGGSTLAMALNGLPITGCSLTTCAACASGLVSMGVGMSKLASGELDVVLCGGYDPVSEYAYGGFNSLRLITESAQQPFSKNRQGLKLAEGYGVVVLERRSDVIGSSRAWFAELLSCTSTSDAHHLSQPHPEGEGASAAIRQALDEAGIEPGDVAMIAAHATATPDNDRAESLAYAKTLGERLQAIPVTAMKSHLGHTLGAAGAVETVLTIKALQQGIVPALANVSADDVEFDDMNIVTGEPAAITGQHALITSLGFGGSNACAVIKSKADHNAAEEQAAAAMPSVQASSATNRQPVVTGIGVVYPGAVGTDAFVQWLDSGETSDALTPDRAELKAHLNARRTRRLSNYVKLLLAATSMACKHAGIDDVPGYPGTFGAITGTMHGSAKFSEDYYNQLVEEGVDFVNPLLFAEGVPNAGTAHLSMMLNLKGPTQTLIGGRTAGLDALNLSAHRIATGQWDAAIVGAGEEMCDMIPRVYRSCGLHAEGLASLPFEDEGGFVSSGAAVTLVLESREAAEQRGATIYGTIESWDQTCWNSDKIKPGIAQIGAMLAKHGTAEHYISSANGTRLDRIEALALRVGTGWQSTEAAVSSASPRLHETFSAGPLLSIAATLLRRKALGLAGGGLDQIDGLRPAQRDEPVQRFAVLSTDYTGVCSGAWLRTASPVGD